LIIDILNLDDILKLPAADTLVPLNPGRYPAYIARTGYFDDFRFAERGIDRAFENVQTSLDYLATAHNYLHYNERYNERCRTLFQDTGIVNLMSEIGGTPGSFLAGGVANELANNYQVSRTNNIG